MAQFSNYALNMMATRLSQFNAPVIPELSLRDDKTLQNHLLESVVGVFGGTKNAHARHLVTNVVRRIFGSIETYRLGRTHALDYVQGDRFSRVSPYFLSLTFFECCLSYSWQVCDFLNDLAQGKERVFQRGDGSAWERLHLIYTQGTKHSYGRFDPAAHGEMPTTLWLANDGIDCVNGARISFQELAEIIAANNELFYDIQTKARSIHKQATHGVNEAR